MCDTLYFTYRILFSGRVLLFFNLCWFCQLFNISTSYSHNIMYFIFIWLCIFFLKLKYFLFSEIGYLHSCHCENVFVVSTESWHGTYFPWYVHEKNHCINIICKCTITLSSKIRSHDLFKIWKTSDRLERPVISVQASLWKLVWVSYIRAFLLA